MFKSFAASFSLPLRDPCACVGAGEADWLRAFVFDDALTLGSSRIIIHIHEVGPSVAGTNLEKTIDTAAALISFL